MSKDSKKTSNLIDKKNRVLTPESSYASQKSDVDFALTTTAPFEATEVLLAEKAFRQTFELLPSSMDTKLTPDDVEVLRSDCVQDYLARLTYRKAIARSARYPADIACNIAHEAACRMVRFFKDDYSHNIISYISTGRLTTFRDLQTKVDNIIWGTIKYAPLEDRRQAAQVLAMPTVDLAEPDTSERADHHTELLKAEIVDRASLQELFTSCRRLMARKSRSKTLEAAANFDIKLRDIRAEVIYLRRQERGENITRADVADSIGANPTGMSDASGAARRKLKVTNVRSILSAFGMDATELARAYGLDPKAAQAINDNKKPDKK